jgi:hypothetical protein
MKLLLLIFSLLAVGFAQSADLFYKKNLSLHVIHDVDQGKKESVPLDTSVGDYISDAGAVLYVKGQSLYLIQNTRDPKPMSLGSGIAVFELNDGLIAYIKGDSLYVRRVSDAATQSARLVANSEGVSSIDVAGGMIVFLKNQTTLYRVIDMESGTSERVIYPVGEVQASGH